MFYIILCLFSILYYQYSIANPSILILLFSLSSTGLSFNNVRELRNLVHQTRQKVGQARQRTQERKEQVELDELKQIAHSKL